MLHRIYADEIFESIRPANLIGKWGSRMLTPATKRRIIQLRAIELAKSIGDAAIGDIKNWPANGLGRQVKSLSEQVMSVLDGANSFGTVKMLVELRNARTLFTKIQENAYFESRLSSLGYSDGTRVFKSFQDTIYEVIGEIDILVAPLDESLIDGTNVVIQKVSQISPIIPKEKISPLYFDVIDGVLRVRNVETRLRDIDRASVDDAIEYALSAIESIVSDIENSNGDRRVVHFLRSVAGSLSNQPKPIQIGLAAESVKSIVERCDDELSQPTLARMASLSLILASIASQFDEWIKFRKNCNDVELNSNAVTEILTVARSVSDSLKSNNLVDSSVPDAIRTLADIASQQPRSKLAANALARGLSNLAITLSRKFVEIANSAFEGASAGVKLSATVGTFGGLLWSVIRYFDGINPQLAKLLEIDWVRAMLEIILK